MKSAKPSSKPRILLTSALPYANGSIHIGHLVEYIQTDIFSRFLKLTGNNVIYCCADDAHGTAIEIKASQEGITPEELIAKVKKEHEEDFSKFHIHFDNYYSTHSEENKELSILIYERLKKKGLIYTKDIESYYDEKAKRFLPDRYIKGKCPKCGAEDQYGDVCEKCNSTYKPTDLVDPYSTVTRTTPIRKTTKHYFFKLSSMSDKLRSYFKERNFQPEVINYLNNWLDEGLQDWDISRDGPYFGFKIPEEEDKYFYVWLDAPIGYFASCKNYCEKNNLNPEDYLFNDGTKIYHVIGKDIMYFHFLFWPAMLIAADFNIPDDIIVHGFLTVNKEKMSKSRGTFLLAKEFAEMCTPEYLRYYYAKVLSKKLNDIDLDLNSFVDSVNNELAGNIGNFCYRALSFIDKNFNSEVAEFNDDDYPVINEILSKIDSVKENYQNLNFNKAVSGIMEISSFGNKFFQEQAPWQLRKDGKDEEANKVCAVCCNIAKILSIIIAPVLPVFSENLQKQLGVENATWDDIKFDIKGKKISKPEILIKKIEEKIEIKVKGKEERDISINVDPKVKELGIKACIAQINGVKVKKKHEGLEKLKDATAKEVKGLDVHQHKVIQEYNHIYKRIGAAVENPTLYLHRLVEEKGQLPQINTVVDSYNIISAKTLLAFGAHDLNKINGDIHLRFVNDNDKYAELGTSTVEKLPSNEFAYIDDDNNVLCRLNIKQGNHTKVDENTQNVVLIVDGNKEVSDEELYKATEEACKHIVKYCGGTYDIIESGDKFLLNLKVAEVKEAKLHPNSDKLIIMQIDCGEKRQIVAGLQKNYKPEELVGKKIIIVSNLKPAKLGGELSQGMLLAASKGDNHVVIELEGEPGDAVACGDKQNSTKEITIKDFLKLKTEVKGKKVLFNGTELVLNGKSILVDVEDGYSVG